MKKGEVIEFYGLGNAKRIYFFQTICRRKASFITKTIMINKVHCYFSADFTMMVGGFKITM